DRPTKELRISLTIDSARWHHRGQHSSRHAQFVENDVIPVALVDVVEQGTRGVGGIGDMDSTFRDTPHQKRVYVTEERLTPISLLAQYLDVVQNPLDFGAGEICIGHQARTLTDLLVEAFCLQSITDRDGQAALPDDGIENRFTSVLVPDDGRFSL